MKKIINMIPQNLDKLQLLKSEISMLDESQVASLYCHFFVFSTSLIPSRDCIRESTITFVIQKMTNCHLYSVIDQLF